MKKLSMILLAMVFSIGLSAQTIDNVSGCNLKVIVHVQSTLGCGPSLGTMTLSIGAGMTTLPALPPGYNWFAAEVFEPSGTFILGVASACSSCGIPTSNGSYACTVSGNVTADWTTCTTLTIDD